MVTLGGHGPPSPSPPRHSMKYAPCLFPIVRSTMDRHVMTGRWARVGNFPKSGCTHPQTRHSPPNTPLTLKHATEPQKRRWRDRKCDVINGRRPNNLDSVTSLQRVNRRNPFQKFLPRGEREGNGWVWGEGEGDPQSCVSLMMSSSRRRSDVVTSLETCDVTSSLRLFLDPPLPIGTFRVRH
jgi:hypothetical protein